MENCIKSFVLVFVFALLSINGMGQSKPQRDVAKDRKPVVLKPQKSSVSNRTQKAHVGNSHKKKVLDYTPGRAIDLGLPSGTLWADRNLGASSETDEGGLYIWGDPTGNNQTSNVPDYISEMSHTEYDIATARWGYEWYMPTTEQFIELHEKCSIKKIKKSGIEGYLVTGPNGNTLFFPFSSLYKEKFGGWDYHMSWTAYKDSEQKAWACNLINGFFYWSPTSKATIRPVQKK